MNVNSADSSQVSWTPATPTGKQEAPETGVKIGDRVVNEFATKKLNGANLKAKLTGLAKKLFTNGKQLPGQNRTGDIASKSWKEADSVKLDSASVNAGENRVKTEPKSTEKKEEFIELDLKLLKKDAQEVQFFYNLAGHAKANGLEKLTLEGREGLKWKMDFALKHYEKLNGTEQRVIDEAAGQDVEEFLKDIQSKTKPLY